MSGNLVDAYKAAFSRLPGVAIEAAERAAPDLADLARADWDARETPFGDSFGVGKTGNPITLDKTGALKASEQFVAVGTSIVVRVDTPYAKYQLKRGFLPLNGIPRSWSDAIAKRAEVALQEALK